MAGISSYGSYIPYYRLQRGAIGVGKGERAIASFDEDSISMAVEAGREALREGQEIDTIVFATTNPPYAEKLNAVTVATALGLPAATRSIDVGNSSRAGLGAFLLAADVAAGGRNVLLAASDVVIGGPGGVRESSGGDGAVAFVLGDEDGAGARILGRASATTEVLDVWRTPEDRFAKQWEERFGAEVLGPVLVDTVMRALRDAKTEPGQLTKVVLDAANPRAASGLPKAMKLQTDQIADSLAVSVGRTGVAHALLIVARTLDDAKPGDRILVTSLADGCEAVVLEVTGGIEAARPKHSVDDWIASKDNSTPYNTYLKWRGILPFEPPRRPDPERPTAPAMHRHEAWKYTFTGSRCTECNTGHLPPQRVCIKCAAIDAMKPEKFTEVGASITTYTIDHLAYSLNPPTVVAVVDFEGGGRFQSELTDGDPADVKIGNQLEMTFRRLFTAQSIHNYFWKARPCR